MNTRQGNLRGKYTLHKDNPTSFKAGMTPANKGKGAPTELDLTCSVCHKVWHWKAKTIKRKDGYVQYTNVKNPPKTCSKECRYNSSSKANSREKIKRICATCKREFKIFPAWVNKNRGYDGTYCSVKCRWGQPIPYTKKQKSDARNAINQAVISKRLTRKPCIICGETKTLAHHYKGYLEENWLAIQWYCKLHHVQEHERLRRTGESLLL